jgi:hypothetical protein
VRPRRQLGKCARERHEHLPRDDSTAHRDARVAEHPVHPWQGSSLVDWPGPNKRTRHAKLRRRFDQAPLEKSLLKLKPGDEINLTEADFVRLSEDFFAEMEKRFL